MMCWTSSSFRPDSSGPEPPAGLALRVQLLLRELAQPCIPVWLLPESTWLHCCLTNKLLTCCSGRESLGVCCLI